MSDVFIDMFFVLELKKLNWEEKFHDSLLLDGLHFDQMSKFLMFEGGLIFEFLYIFVGDLFEKLEEKFFHFLNGEAGT